jgi:hypothetical protein
MSRNKKLQAKKKKALKRNARQAEYRNRPRACGDCRACCFVFPLIDKPENCWCKHSTPEGCDCYGNRPSVCRKYSCLYLYDKWCPPSWRPDRSGIIITYRGTFHGHPIYYLSQCWQNAIDGLAGRSVLSALKNSNAIILYTVGGSVATCYSHTGLVLDVDGRKELMHYIVDNAKEETERIAEESFDFYQADQTHCRLPRREPRDTRMARLELLDQSA